MDEKYCQYCDYLLDHCHCPLKPDPNWCSERCHVACWQGCPGYYRKWGYEEWHNYPWTWQEIRPRMYYKNEQGYFFMDETENFWGNGPYKTLEDCALGYEFYFTYEL